MEKKAHLESEAQAYFDTVSKAVFSNPFDDQISAEIRKHSPNFEPRHELHKHSFNALVPELKERIEHLDQQGFSHLKRFKDDDRKRMEHAYLFFVFHKYIDELDNIIKVQALEDEPIPVPCAEPILAQLKTRGFTDPECVRYLALFYQIRRAYFFIVQSLVGDSACMKQLRRHLWNSVFTHDIRLYDQYLWNRMEDFSTLLLGETGTGKGAAAAAIGRSAFIPFNRGKGCFEESFKHTFVAINLSQFPETLIESELFGHRKGAFTGAMDHYKGVFERCSSHGALFLDEIGDVSIQVQIKLLQVLQERNFSPVGSHSVKRFSGRVIAATNRPLDELRQQEKFRHDFFYRLCSDVITVPPLRLRIRESREELPNLIQLLVHRLTGHLSEDLTAMVLSTLQKSLPKKYPWPGNVRELEQAVRRVLLSQEYLGDWALQTSETNNLEQQLSQGKLNARELLSHYCRLLYKKYGTYEQVAQKTELDRRTVKKYIEENT